MRLHRPVPLSTRPRVSVVVPCYNYGRFLPEAVSSALDQEGLDVDVLIVDDASTDDSADVALRLAQADPRVDVLLHETNRGHIQTYNDGLTKVTGDYVVLLSADDLLGRNALTRAVALMERFPRVGLVYGWAQSFSRLPTPEPYRTRHWSTWPGREWLGLAARRGRCFLLSPEAVMRREAFAETGGYDARLPHSGDFDMWMRTAARWDVGRVNETQAFYREHDQNMHRTMYAGWLTDLQARRDTFRILRDERAPDLPGIAALHRRATRALAREALRRGLRALRDDEHRAEGKAVLAAMVDFARETDHRSLLGVWGWTAQRRLRTGDTGRLVGTRRLLTRIHDHAVWRRDRRFGT